MAPPPRSREILELAKALRQSYEEAERLSTSLGIQPNVLKKALAAMKELDSVNATSAQRYRLLNDQLGLSQSQVDDLTEATRRLAREGFSGILESLGKVSFAYNNIIGFAQTLGAVAKQGYDIFISQNVELQNQLLATRSSIAATNKVLENGAEIKDPTKAIQALEQPVNEAIAQLRKGSLDLVGVTSKDLVPVFQIIAGQSASIGATLSQSSDLTLSFAAALGTLQIPLNQANEEVNSILNGTITFNSRLAKSIGLNNEMVEKWRSQGVLVERLTERLSAFRSGNALAAQTISGVSSNIQEVFDEITRLAGEPFLDPIVKSLNAVYQYLKDNQELFKDLATRAANLILTTSGSIANIVKNVAPFFTEGLGNLTTDIGDFAFQLATTLKTIVNITEIATAKLKELKNFGDQNATFIKTIGVDPLEPFRKGAEALELFNTNWYQVGDIAEENRKQIDAIADSVIKNATSLKSLNDAEIASGELTKEQTEQRKKLRIEASGYLENLQAQLKGVKDAYAQIPDPNYKAQIEQLETLIKLLQKQVGAVKTQVQDLPQLGSIYTQLDAQVTAALNKFKKPATQDELINSAKTLLNLYEQQNALGAVDPTKLAEGIKAIRDDTRLQFDIRLNAQQTLTKLLQGETEKRVKLSEIETQRVQALTSDGFVGQFESQRLLTEEKRKQLQIQIEALKKAIADENALRQEQATQTIAKLDKDIAEAQKRKVAAESAIAQGQNVPQNQANIRLANSEIQALETKKAIARQSLALDSETLAASKSQLAARNAELAKTNADLRKAEKEEALRDFDEKQKIADAYYERGLISQEKYNDLTYGLTVERLQEELRQVESSQAKLDEQQKRTGKRDKEGQEALAAQRADIAKKLVQAEVKLQDDRIRVIEQKQKEAYDLVILSEAERAQAIAQFRLQQPTEQARANQLEVEASRKKIQSELALEQDKLKQLQAQESVGNEARERDRVAKIQASQVRVAQLTTQLVQNEIQERQKAFEVIKENLEDEIAERQNITTAVVQGLERQKQAQDALNQSLQFERDLIESKRSLLSSVSDFYQAELKILSETATTEVEKQQIAETTAEIQLKTVKARAEIEKQILEINLQQKQAALEIEALNLRSQAAQAQSDVLIAQNKQQIVNQDPNATAAQKEAARLDVEAAQIKQQGIGLQIGLLAPKQELLNRQAGLERDALDRRLATELDQAELARANADTDPFQQFVRREAIRNRIQNRLGIEVGQYNSTEDVEKLGSRIDFDLLYRQKFNPTSLQPSPEAIAQTRSAFAQAFPGLDLSKLPTSQLSIPTTGSAIAPTAGTQASGEKVVKADAVNITLNTYLNQDDTDAAKLKEKIVQPLRQELKELGLALLQK